MADSYAAVSDVERYTQLGPYGAGTIPTATQVQAFLDTRAGQIYMVLARELGSAAVGPVGSPGYANEIVTTTDHGFALNKFLIQLNALGASHDALEAAGGGDQPSRTERATEFLEEFYRILDGVGAGSLAEAVGIYIGTGGLAAGTHISAGQVVVPSRGTTYQADPTFSASTEW